MNLGLRVAEDEGETGIELLEKLGKGIELFLIVHPVKTLLDPGDCELLVDHPDGLWIPHVPAGEAQDASGTVAEKRTVWRFPGVLARMASMSSMKPMSSITSPSSRTTYFTVSRETVRRRRWSRSRPGVAMTT
jgi:hypothetical protein